MPRTRGGAGLLALLLLAALGCVASPRDDEEAQLERVRRATFLIEDGRCAGAVVSDGTLGLTAAHCILPGEAGVSVRFEGAADVWGRLLLVEREHDVALIQLPRSVRVDPLPLALAAPAPGEALLFVGRPDRNIEPQHPRRLRLGRGPALPEVPDALFTTVEGRPGDSGAPILDGSLRVVGLVHGGAACSIAAPAWEVSTLIAGLQAAGSGAQRQARTPARRPR